jgi:hypothetical protein
MNPHPKSRPPSSWPKALLIFLFTASPLFSLQNPAGGGCFVYPSPVSGNWAWAVYNMGGSGSAQISVYNEAGDLVTQETVPGGPGIQQTPIDLTHYRKGIYICRVVVTLDSGVSQALQFFKFVVIR